MKRKTGSLKKTHIKFNKTLARLTKQKTILKQVTNIMNGQGYHCIITDLTDIKMITGESINT